PRPADPDGERDGDTDLGRGERAEAGREPAADRHAQQCPSSDSRCPGSTVLGPRSRFAPEISRGGRIAVSGDGNGPARTVDATDENRGGPDVPNPPRRAARARCAF